MSARRKKEKSAFYRLTVFIVTLLTCIGAAISFVLSSGFPISIQAKESKRTANDPRWEIPQTANSDNCQLIEHTGYTVCYNHKWNLPFWVAYELTKQEVAGDNTRSDKFLPDPMVKGNPVVSKDYSNSGYDRGHMAPAGDMKWSEQAMKESFYMTNICPQNHNNNAGDWKDLEELVRDLAAQYGAVYICCGPIVTDHSNTIGDARKIVVPQAFFKVLLRKKAESGWTAIGFVMPNTAGNHPLMTYMRSVDEVEKMSGIDFFCNLPDSIEKKVEADFNISDWIVKRK